MTIEENQELKEALKNQGLVIKTRKVWSKHEWVAGIKYNGEIIKVVDCSYENMTDIKYMKKFSIDNSYFNNEWVMKSLKKCTVEEVLLNIKSLFIQIKKQKMIEKLNRIEKDFE